MNSVKKLDALAIFETAALPHVADLYRCAMALLGDPSEAEAAVEESLQKAWQSADRFRPGANCRPGLYRILFQVVSRRRQALPRPSHPARLVVSKDDLLGVLRRMPEQVAQVVLLADVHEFTYQEIQETLGISESMLALRLRSGRDELAGAAPDDHSGRPVWRRESEENRRLEAAQ
ncbi:MAG TPA: sigma factor-like helix-turn-helix DNA-binding protein [Bryobacteraceae bacterium]|nr:sigma factor-like helix-turn-helix DNA-binding protein [Bryobacteraceae bacterium]